jgi:predicted DNA binding protein/CheY-like chemotaxis protein
VVGYATRSEDVEIFMFGTAYVEPSDFRRHASAPGVRASGASDETAGAAGWSVMGELDPGSGSAAGAGAGRPVVLVVDDDEDLADTYALWLEEEFEVRTAYSGDAAIDSVDDDVDVVLLDRRMPAMPGDEVLAEIRDRDLDCQVSMLTAVEPDSDVVSLPFDDYLVKPVTQSDVVEVIDDLLLRTAFDEETQEFLALDATAETLSEREASEFRDPEAVAGLREDVADAEDDERIRAQVARLEHLKRVNALVRSVDRALVEASSRAEIERMASERLVEDGPYRFAWVGGYVETFDQFNPRTTSDGGDVAGATIDAGEGHPVAEAVASASVVVTDAETVVGDGTREALPDGDGRAVVVPLTHRDTTYGALVAHAGAEYEVTDRGREVLSELGDTIANAVSAVESQQLLRSDTVVELDLRVTDREAVLVDLAAALDATVTLEGFAPGTEGAVTCYATVRDASTDAVLSHLTETAAVATHRSLDDRGDATQVECTLVDRSVVQTVVDAGANVRNLTVDRGEGSLAVEVAPDADPRTVMEAVEGQFPETELTAKREAERSVQSVGGFRTALDDRLTDRQRAVVEATYSAGYFAWPRESTAEEVAEAFDVAPPTLHEHLREAQRKLVETYLEEAE